MTGARDQLFPPISADERRMLDIVFGERDFTPPGAHGDLEEWLMSEVKREFPADPVQLLHVASWAAHSAAVTPSSETRRTFALFARCCTTQALSMSLQ